jgi:tetratricopeptide (TPR) repeat protein
VEAELFGFEAGTFTDARRAKPGLLEAASGGTVFLDEIEALPLALQSKFLTALEEKWVRRLGAVEGRAVDVKIIAATTADLADYAAAGRFRPDLYQRLAVVVLTLPPLRERAEDLLLLAEHCLRRYAEAHGVRPKRLSQAAETWLCRYQWPGNVRELSHLVERVTLLSPEAIVSPSTLEALCLPQPPTLRPTELMAETTPSEAIEEWAQIEAVLRQTRGNVVQAARLLGLSRGALRHRLRRYGLQRPQEQAPALAPSWTPPRGQRPMPPEVERAAERPPAPPAAWEHKPVAVLAIELTFPTITVGEAVAYEPWTAARRWEQTLVEKVQGFGGVVLQRSPALLVVAFGLPQTLEQQPQRAVQAALALRQLVAEGADQASCPVLRLVVHWGEGLVDMQASDLTAQLRALGETLAWPVRLLGQVAPGEIVLSPAMRPLVEGWCEVQPRQVALPGDPAPRIEVSGVVGNRPAGARPGRRPLSPFVGREEELATVRARVRQVEGGRGQVVAVLGEPGTGKSRLCDECVQGLLTSPWRILHTQGTAAGQAMPYEPVRDLLQGYFQLDGHADQATIRAQVTATLGTLDTALTPTVPAFLTLLDGPEEDPLWQALEPAHRRQQTLEALKQLFVREAQRQPLLLLVEDLQWLDTETQAVLDTLVDSLPTARMLLLVNYRPEYHHGWGSKTTYTQLRLDPLPSASAAALLQSLLGDDSSLAPLKPLLIARTEGNPFFLEECVRTLVETGGLVGAPGAYRLAQALPTIQVPATVQAVLAARIDRLPPEVKALLQTAAVIGHEVPWPLLQAVADLPEDTLHRGLAHLQATEFLYQTSLFPEIAYTFTHALTQQVAYETLVQERRRAMHARLVAALEVLAEEQVAESVDRLAYHALRSEVWDKAVTYSQQAGARAYARAAFREAVAYFDQALQALSHLPEHSDTRRLAIDLRLTLGHSLRVLGEYERWRAVLSEAEALARRLDDQPRLGRVLDGLARVMRRTGDSESAIAVGQRTLALAVELGDRTLQGQVSFTLGQAYYFIGDFGKAVELLRQRMEAAAREPRTPRTGLIISSLAWLARALSALGAFTEGRRYGEEALRLATVDAQGNAPIVAHNCLGLLYLTQGDLDAAIRVLEPGLALCRTSGNRNDLRSVAAHLGLAYALVGRLDEGTRAAGGGDQRNYQHGQAANAFPLSCLAQRGLSSGGTRRGGAAVWAPGTRPRQAAQGTRERGAGAAPARRRPGPRRFPRRHTGRSQLPAGPGAGRRARHAPARGPLLPRARPAVPPDRPW